MNGIKNKIAIHHNSGSFSDRWIEYCKLNNIPYKIVNCLNGDIYKQLENCSALMWNFIHTQINQCLKAKEIIKKLDSNNFPVFPNYSSMNHYDNKIKQKFLLESIGAPLIPTHVFYNKDEAINWSKKINYPIVFKLSTGAGSSNVKLVHSKKEIIQYIEKSFGIGYSPLDRKALFKDRIWHLYRDKDLKSVIGLFKGLARLLIPTKFERLSKKERGYVYFQDFIPKNSYDIRIIVIGNRAFAIKRNVRKGDFRASGSGDIDYNQNLIDIRCIEISFEISKKLGFNSMTYDYVFDESNKPLLIEISYCYSYSAYYLCPGYWDESLRWNAGHFKSQDFMVEDIINKI